MMSFDFLLWTSEIALALFSVIILKLYFGSFFGYKKLKVQQRGIYILFFLWQFPELNHILRPDLRITLNVVMTIITVVVLYKGHFLNKFLFVIAFNALGMMMETLCGYVFLIYFTDHSISWTLGSFLSKLLLLCIVLALKKVFTHDDIRDLPIYYSVMLILIPIGSIYIVNYIFMISSTLNSSEEHTKALLTSFILLVINILIFYLYLKLTDDLRIKQNNILYRQQFELYDKHQREREEMIMQMRDVKHNMKNNLITIIAYAENDECNKVIKFAKEIMESSALNVKLISNTGNIVIDSLINYWFSVAQKYNIDFMSDVSVPIDMSFQSADLCLILGNVLENAVEATQKCEENKYIKLKIKYDRGNLLIYIVNSFNGQINKTKEGFLKTTKSNPECHGIGLQSIYRTVKNYNGSVFFYDSDKCFTLKIVLYDTKI